MSECEWVWAQCSTPATQKPRRSAHCATPATQKRRRPKGRQGVHPTPWQCTLSHACHAKEAETQGTPGRTSDPLAVHIVPRLPRKRGGDPRDARAYIRPFGSAHCATPATQKRRRPKGRQGVHPTPWQIRPLGSAHCAKPATQKRRRPKGRQGVHPTPWQCTLCHACHAKEAETQGTPGRTSDIRPLGSAHCATPATQKRRRPKGRQGVHPTPWQCTLCHACHAKEAETQGTPGRTSDPLAVHIVPRLPRTTQSEWVREWVSVCVSVCVWVCEWVSVWVSVSEWVWVSVCEVSEWVCEWGWVSECVSEWVSVCEWVSVTVCVSEEEDGRAAGGRRWRIQN